METNTTDSQENLDKAVRAWSDSLKTGVRELRDAGERDTLCPDRVVAYGHRTVSRAGGFRFAAGRANSWSPGGMEIETVPQLPSASDYAE